MSKTVDFIGIAILQDLFGMLTLALVAYECLRGWLASPTPQLSSTIREDRLGDLSRSWTRYRPSPLEELELGLLIYLHLPLVVLLLVAMMDF